MWYVYLNREQHYLRSYRTHNLWFDQYQKKLRVPRATPFHIGLFKRLGKTYSGVSTPHESHHPLTHLSIGSSRFRALGLHCDRHGQVRCQHERRAREGRGYP